MSACSIRLSRRLDGFIAGAAASTLSRSPNSLMSCAAPFGPMPGTPGTLSIGVADQRLHVDHLVRRDAELLHHLGRPDRLLLDRVQHLHAGADELHQVLVGRHDGRLPAGVVRRLGIGGDQVVRLPVVELDRRARRTPRSPRAPGRTAGSGRRAAAGGAPCRLRTAGCGTSSGRHRRSPRYACRHARAAAWPACWRSRTPRSPACRPAASSAAARGRRGR